MKGVYLFDSIVDFYTLFSFNMADLGSDNGTGLASQ
jgi:hypothetical protein